MAARIRLTRIGAKKRACYRIVVIDSHNSRDGRQIELIGHYDPKKGMEAADIKTDRLRYWLGCGVKPTATVSRLIKKKGILISQQHS